MIKKLLSITLVIVMIASVLCIGVNADPIAIGNYYYTDIQTYVRGKVMESYNIGGKTVIVAESLAYHGFNVSWDPTARTLSINDTNGTASGTAFNTSSGKIGATAGAYYRTDIVTYFNGAAIESYNLDGRTVIPATLLRDFGYNVEWNEENRVVLINTNLSDIVIGSSDITNVTVKANQTYHGTIAITADAVNFNGNRLVTSHDCYIETSLDKKIYVPFKAFADCLGISYAWDSATSTLKVSVPDDKVIAAKESKLKTNYKNYGAVEYEIKDIVLNIVNDGETFNDVDAILYGTEVFVEASELANALNFFCVNQVDFYTQTMMYLVYSGLYSY